MPMNRELNESEKSIYNLFKDQLTLKQNKECSQISLSVKKQKFFVSNPLVYEIEGTDSVLILGEPRQTINIDMLRKLYEEQLKRKVQEDDNKVKEENNTVVEEETVKSELSPEMKEEYIKMVQSQFDLPKEEVEKILKENDYDIVKTLMQMGNK